MNAPVPNLKTTALQNMLVHVAGRIESSSKYQDSFTTLVKTPAPDAYSHPSTIELRSKARLGQIGDEIAVVGRLTGVPRKFNRTDKSSGEITMVKTADMYLHLVE